MELTNRNIKSSVFTNLFQDCENAQKNALELYNSIKGTAYTDASIIEHIKTEQSIYRYVKHDVAFKVGDTIIVLIEHQSTINPNMPLRALMYLGRAYEKIIARKLRYSKKLIKIPCPEVYVFYNGTEYYPDESTLYLSDAFVDNCNAEPDLAVEVKVKVYNINNPEHIELAKNCKILSDYSRFINKCRENMNADMENPISEAIRYCIKNEILKDFLEKEGDAVMSFLTDEYDYDTDISVNREESKAEGIEIGIVRGMEKERCIVNKLNQRLMDDERYDDLRRSTIDRDFQNKLIEEYGITE